MDAPGSLSDPEHHLSLSLSTAPPLRACLTPTLLLIMGGSVMPGKVQRPKCGAQEAGGRGLGARHKTRGVQVQKEEPGAEGGRAWGGPGASRMVPDTQQ